MRNGNRWTVRLSVIFFLLFFAQSAVVSAGTIPGYDGNATVYDGAGVFGGGERTVKVAAERLIQRGADVRVVTVDSYGNEPNLDEYYLSLERGYPSWRVDGERKNNLIVFIIAKNDRKTGIYYGDEWDRVLRDEWKDVTTKYMNPSFKRGEFVDGFVRGIERTTAMVDNYLDSPSSGDSAPPVVIVERPQSDPVSVQSSEPVDLSGLWSILGWGLALVAVAGAVFFVVIVWKQRKRDEDERKGVQQKAKMAKQSVADALSIAKKSMENLESLVPVLISQLDESGGAELLNALDDLKNRRVSIVSEYASTQTSAGDPDSEDLSKSQYGAMHKRYDALLEKVTHLVVDVKAFEKETYALRDLISGADEAVKYSESVIEKATGVVGAVRRQGFKTPDADQALMQANDFLGHILHSIESKRYTDIPEKQKKLEAKTDAAAQAALAIKSRKKTIEERTERLRVALPGMDDMIERGRKTFEVISARYSPRSWDPVKGNGTEAERRRIHVAQAIGTVCKLASMEQQDWVGAETLLERAEAAVAQCDSLMRSVIAMRQHLETAEANVRSEVGESKRDIVKAWQYIKAHDDDIRESLEGDLRNAEKILQVAIDELALERPDYIRAFKAAQQVNNTADRVFAEAVEEHERQERLRKRLSVQLEIAEGAVSDAEEYFEDHGSDIGRSLEDKLGSIRKRYDQARQTDSIVDLAVAIAVLESIESDAESVLDDAKNEVSEAQAARNVSWGSRDDDDDFWGSSGGGSTDWNFGGSSGGGSTDWGGSFGGGGSSSWSSGSGGGGSTGW